MKANLAQHQHIRSGATVRLKAKETWPLFFIGCLFQLSFTCSSRLLGIDLALLLGCFVSGILLGLSLDKARLGAVKTSKQPLIPLCLLLDLSKESFGSGDMLWVIALICGPQRDDEDLGVSCDGGNGQ